VPCHVISVNTPLNGHIHIQWQRFDSVTVSLTPKLILGQSLVLVLFFYHLSFPRCISSLALKSRKICHGHGLCSCNPLTETNKFGFVASFLLYLVSELQKNLYWDSNQGQFLGVVEFVSVISLKKLWYFHLLLLWLVFKLQEPPSLGLEQRTIFWSCDVSPPPVSKIKHSSNFGTYWYICSRAVSEHPNIHTISVLCSIRKRKGRWGHLCKCGFM
jgi:hypothetical protein